jgi:hypothetical protein
MISSHKASLNASVLFGRGANKEGIDHTCTINGQKACNHPSILLSVHPDQSLQTNPAIPVPFFRMKNRIPTEFVS